MIAGISLAIPGLIVLAISIPFFSREKRIAAKCTGTTYGRVIGYVIRGGDNNVSVAPKVEFSVEGVKYKAYRHYRGVVSVSRTSYNPDSIAGQQDSFWISDRDVFHANIKGAFHNYKAIGEASWPLGTELPVVYNPDKPKQAFVEKVVTINKVWAFVLMGVGLLFALQGIIAFLIGYYS